MCVIDFIDKLLEIFSDYPELDLISFTDHNYISYDVYKEFLTRKTNINIIPGIEIDVSIDGIKDSKHLLFYFNIKELDKLKTFSEQINKFLEGKSNVNINELLQFLISTKIEFLISPHAFKQGKRSINYDWNDEVIAKDNMHKFMDQFFCFWEVGGYSEIAKAVEFLKEFDSEELISIISFSDSSDEKKLRNYLSNPPQYFKSLPTFKGVQLVGTDVRRILKYPRKLDPNNSGNIIGYIEINNEKIELSDQLNVIVGGRGSGKSLLLDSMALHMLSDVREKERLNDDRIKFLDTLPMSIMNLDNKKIAIDSKKIDFYDQSYVSKIFNSKDSNKEIESYFKDEFDELGELNLENKKQEVQLKFKEFLNNNKVIKPNDNISDFIGKYKIIDEKEVNLRFKKTEIKEKKLIEFNLEDAIKHSKDKSKLIPKELTGNKEVKEALFNLLRVINSEVSKYNIRCEQENFENIIKKKFILYLENKKHFNKREK